MVHYVCQSLDYTLPTYHSYTYIHTNIDSYQRGKQVYESKNRPTCISNTNFWIMRE